MAEKRRSKRVPLRVIVRYGTSHPPEYTAFLTDFSGGGVNIKTNRVFKPGTKLIMEIEIDGRVFNAAGVVVWARQVPQTLSRIVKNGMGIRFTRLDKDMLAIYNSRIT